MKVIFSLVYFTSISICLINCSNNNSKNIELSKAKQPVFEDNGKTIDSLKRFYNCESIDYENFGNKKVIDSCLTVCLINSTKVPSTAIADESANQLKAIALAVKKALSKPKQYKSFYIIFVKKEMLNGQEIKVHSNGMEISDTEF